MRVLVTGAGGPAGRSLCLQLRDRGHAVLGVDMASVVLEVLTDLAEGHGADLLLPTVSEELTSIADYAYGRCAPGVAVAVGPPAAVRIADDKWLTCRRLALAGLGVPRFALPSEVCSPAVLATRIGTPFVVKPRVGRGGRGVSVYQAAGSSSHRRDGDLTIVQEFVPAEEYAPNLFLAEDPRRDVVVALRKTALVDGDVGNALGVRRVAAPDVTDLARAAGRALGLTGPVDMDIRRRNDGTPVVLEVNARVGAHSHHAPEVLDALLAEQGGPTGRCSGRPARNGAVSSGVAA